MKKIMIALAVAAFAVASQAATVSWMMTKVYTPGSTTEFGVGYAGYFFQVSDTVTTAAIEGAILDGTFTGTGALATASVAANGGISKTGIGNYDDNSGSVSWFAVLFNAESYADATKYIMTNPVTQTYTSATGAKIASFANVGTTYQWADVAPEPTSGLLMLLGMAGLALRRRRA